MQDTLDRILRDYRRIAVVGASASPDKPANEVPLIMRERGYAILAVNPRLEAWEGQPAYKSLADVPPPVEVVNVFRPAEEAPAIAREAVKIGAKALWLQTGIRSEEAKRIAEEAGLLYVEDRCVKIESARLRR